MSFKLNNDLDNIQFSFHNLIHFFGALILSVLFGFWISYGLWFLWEIGDGYKDFYYNFRWKDNQSWLVNKFRQECLYSDKFSFQDIFIFNLSGAIIGYVIRMILIGVGVI